MPLARILTGEYLIKEISNKDKNNNMPAVIKITMPDDDWEGWSHTCNNATYHSHLFDNDPEDCPTCEKILKKYYVKYLKSLLDREYPNHEKYVSFIVGPENVDSFDGWVIFFFKKDVIEKCHPNIDWTCKPPRVLETKSTKCNVHSTLACGAKGAGMAGEAHTRGIQKCFSCGDAIRS